MNFSYRALSSFKSVARLGALSVLCLAPSAFADTVNMVMTSKISDLGPPLGGVYTSPYMATVNGTVTTIICDDFFANTSLGQSWQAMRTSFDEFSITDSAVAALRWGTAANAGDRYKQVAWLSLQLLSNIGNTPAQGEISYAIWKVFTPTVVNGRGFSSAQLGRISQWVSDAATAVGTTDWSGGATFTFYTPTPLNASSPQEFISVRTPEPSAVGMLAFNFAALLSFACFLRRRLVFPAN